MADIEKWRFSSGIAINRLMMVDLPLPEGAENMMSFAMILLL